MTPQRLAEIKALSDAASPGPWKVDDLGVFNDANPLSYDISVDEDKYQLCFYESADIRFIAAARTAIPEMLEYINALENCKVWGKE